MCFHQDNSSTLSPTSRKEWVCLAPHTAVNCYSLKWNLPRVRCFSTVISSLVWYTPSVSLFIIFLWLQTASDVSLINYHCYLVKLAFSPCPHDLRASSVQFCNPLLKILMVLRLDTPAKKINLECLTIIFFLLFFYRGHLNITDVSQFSWNSLERSIKFGWILISKFSF